MLRREAREVMTTLAMGRQEARSTWLLQMGKEIGNKAYNLKNLGTDTARNGPQQTTARSQMPRCTRMMNRMKVVQLDMGTSHTLHHYELISFKVALLVLPPLRNHKNNRTATTLLTEPSA